MGTKRIEDLLTILCGATIILATEVSVSNDSDEGLKQMELIAEAFAKAVE